MTTSDLVGVRWRKSSRSGTNANCVEVGAVWRVSTHSGSNANCVEVASGVGGVAVRDSKNPDSCVLMLDGAEWVALLRTIKIGSLDPA
ncbi:DUF397 domain-containing protein [Spirillospora sp. NPDC047418]|jgi:hypothetical protein